MRALRRSHIPAVVIEPGPEVLRHMSMNFMSEECSTEIVRTVPLGHRIADHAEPRAGPSPRSASGPFTTGDAVGIVCALRSSTRTDVCGSSGRPSRGWQAIADFALVHTKEHPVHASRPGLSGNDRRMNDDVNAADDELSPDFFDQIFEEALSAKREGTSFAPRAIELTLKQPRRHSRWRATGQESVGRAVIDQARSVSALTGLPIADLG